MAFKRLRVRIPLAPPQTKRKRYFMNLDKMLLENRISLLRSRDPVVNAKIIRKLERRLRKMVD